MTGRNASWADFRATALTVAADWDEAGQRLEAGELTLRSPLGNLAGKASLALDGEGASSLEARLDGSGLVGERYVLQVSSPGDRPLRSPAEWRRFVGRWVSVLAPEDGGRFEARLLDVTGDAGLEQVTLEQDGKRRNVPLARVKEARLAFRI